MGGGQWSGRIVVVGCLESIVVVGVRWLMVWAGWIEEEGELAQFYQVALPCFRLPSSKSCKTWV